MPRVRALSWPTRIYKPLKQIEPLAPSLGKTRGHWTHNPCVRCTRRSHMSTFELGAFIFNGQEWTTGHTQSAHRSHTQRVCQTHGVTGPTPLDTPWACGPLPREKYKRARALDVHHRTHPERPVLSVRNTCRNPIAPDAPIGLNPHPVPGVRCLTLTEPGTDSTPKTQAQRPVPPRPASGECFSARNSPTTSPNFPPAQ